MFCLYASLGGVINPLSAHLIILLRIGTLIMATFFLINEFSSTWANLSCGLPIQLSIGLLMAFCYYTMKAILFYIYLMGYLFCHTLCIRVISTRHPSSFHQLVRILIIYSTPNVISRSIVVAVLYSRKSFPTGITNIYSSLLYYKPFLFYREQLR